MKCELKEKETKTICSCNALYRKLKMSKTDGETLSGNISEPVLAEKIMLGTGLDKEA